MGQTPGDPLVTTALDPVLEVQGAYGGTVASDLVSCLVLVLGILLRQHHIYMIECNQQLRLCPIREIRQHN